MKRIFITEEQEKLLKENIKIDNGYIFNEDMSTLSCILPLKKEKKLFYKRKDELFNVCKKLYSDSLNLDDVVSIKNELSRLMVDIMQREEPIKDILEKLCYNNINEMFLIPDDMVRITCDLVNFVNSKNTTIHINSINKEIDYDSYADVELSDNEIDKRKLLNLLINGASIVLSKYLLNRYKDEIFKLDKTLYFKYKKLLTLNEYYLTLENAEITDEQPNQSGGVTVKLGNVNKLTHIKSVALCYPILLFQTLKGLFELFISHGLPSDLKQTTHIIDQADSLKNEQYYIVMGPLVWNRIMDILHNNEVDTEVIPNIISSISELSSDDIKNIFKEIIFKTKKGTSEIENIISTVIDDIDYEDFEDRLQQKRNEKDIIIDNEFIGEDELIDDDFLPMDEIHHINDEQKKVKFIPENYQPKCKIIEEVDNDITKYIMEELSINQDVYITSCNIVDEICSIFNNKKNEIEKNFVTDGVRNKKFNLIYKLKKMPSNYLYIY